MWPSEFHGKIQRHPKMSSADGNASYNGDAMSACYGERNRLSLERKRKRARTGHRSLDETTRNPLLLTLLKVGDNRSSKVWLALDGVHNKLSSLLLSSGGEREQLRSMQTILDPILRTLNEEFPSNTSPSNSRMSGLDADCQILERMMQEDWHDFQLERGNIPPYASVVDVIDPKDVGANEYSVSVTFLHEKVDLGVYNSLDEAIRVYDMNMIGGRTLARMIYRYFHRLFRKCYDSIFKTSLLGVEGVTNEEKIEDITSKKYHVDRLFNDKIFLTLKCNLYPALIFPHRWFTSVKYKCATIRNQQNLDLKVDEMVHNIPSQNVLADILSDFVVRGDGHEEKSPVNQKDLVGSSQDKGRCEISKKINILQERLLRLGFFLFKKVGKINRLIHLEALHQTLSSERRAADETIISLYDILCSKNKIHFPTSTKYRADSTVDRMQIPYTDANPSIDDITISTVADIDDASLSQKTTKMNGSNVITNGQKCLVPRKLSLSVVNEVCERSVIQQNVVVGENVNATTSSSNSVRSQIHKYANVVQSPDCDESLSDLSIDSNELIIVHPEMAIFL